MLQLAHKVFFYALAIVPVAVLVYWLAMNMRGKAIKSFAEAPLFRRLAAESSVSKKNLKFILLLLSLCLLIFAMVDPEIGSHEENVQNKGSDIVIALDVSNSMNAQDIAPSRLESAKEAIQQLMYQLHGDRIGIVVFAGQAFVQLPLTSDYGAARMFLDNINTNMIPVQGTAIGAAINMSADLFAQEDKNSAGRNKAIILVTDGENFEDDAATAAKNAAAQGITIHTIGMGSPDGAPIPVYTGGQQSGFMKDDSSHTVVTKLNITLLQQIAAAGNGTCIRASSADAGFGPLLDQIRKNSKAVVAQKVYRDYDEQFEWFIIPALLILLADIFITERKTRWYQRLNLFGNGNES